jgi:hypothetical protein
MFDRIKHSLTLRKIPAGREANKQARFQRPMNGGFGSRCDLAAGREQRPVEVDGDHLVNHNITIQTTSTSLSPWNRS